MAKAVTLKTIAKHLNISPSLVSRALNDKYGVSEEVRESVKKAAEELNYIPRLSPSENKRIVLLLLDIALLDIFKDNGLYTYMLKGLTLRLEQESIRVEPVFIQNYTLNELTTLIKSKRPYGIVSLGAISSSCAQVIISLETPFVMVDAYHYEDNAIDLVRANNFAVGYRAAKHLIELGHRNLAFVGNTCYSLCFQNRLDGFLYYINRCGVKDIQWQCLEENAPKEHVCSSELLAKMLSDPKRPSAIVCANDNVAVAVYQQANKLGIVIPDELSLVGCDNNMMPNVPDFATFDLHPFTMGTSTAEYLLKRIADPKSPAQYLQIDPQFRKGTTTAPPSMK